MTSRDHKNDFSRLEYLTKRQTDIELILSRWPHIVVPHTTTVYCEDLKKIAKHLRLGIAKLNAMPEALQRCCVGAEAPLLTEHVLMADEVVDAATLLLIGLRTLCIMMEPSSLKSQDDDIGELFEELPGIAEVNMKYFHQQCKLQQEVLNLAVTQEQLYLRSATRTSHKFCFLLEQLAHGALMLIALFFDSPGGKDFRRQLPEGQTMYIYRTLGCYVKSSFWEMHKTLKKIKAKADPMTFAAAIRRQLDNDRKNKFDVSMDAASRLRQLRLRNYAQLSSTIATHRLADNESETYVAHCNPPRQSGYPSTTADLFHLSGSSDYVDSIDNYSMSTSTPTSSPATMRADDTEPKCAPRSGPLLPLSSTL